MPDVHLVPGSILLRARCFISWERKRGPRIAQAGCYGSREIREFDAGGIVHVYRRLGRHFITAGI